MDGRKTGRVRGLGKWSLVLLGVATASVALWGFSSRVQGAEQVAATYQGRAATSVRTATASEGQISASLAYTADVKSVSQVMVLPKGSGRVEKLLVDVGTRVKQGDPIAQLDADSLKVQLSQAQANLDSVEAKYAGMAEGPRYEQVAQAKAALDAAEARRETVKKGATEADLQAAQSAADSARANLQISQARLDTLKIGPTQSELVAAHASVNSTLASYKAAQANLEEVKAGPRPSAIREAEAAVESARSALYAADDKKDMYDDASDQTRLTLGMTSGSQAQRSADAAKANYDAAVEKLNLLKSKPLPSEVADAESKMEQARAQYDSAQAKLDQMKKGATVQDLQQAEGAVAAAQAALDSAEARLKQVKDGPTEEDLKVAESSVIQAQQQYKLTANPYTSHDLDMAKAGVAQAQAVVDLAQLSLKESVVTSPVDGVVAEKLQSVGSLASPQTPIVSLVSDGVELVLGVEEGQIGQVREGQKVEVTTAAYPGTTFTARVALIAPTADSKTRTFQVKIRPEDQDGKLRQGMAAQVRIVTQEKDRAVLVPKEAVVTRSGQSSVFVMKGDSVEMRSVKMGLAYNGTVEVSGLQPGEEVVVAGQSELRDGDKVMKAS